MLFLLPLQKQRKYPVRSGGEEIAIRKGVIAAAAIYFKRSKKIIEIIEHILFIIIHATVNIRIEKTDISI